MKNKFEIQFNKQEKILITTVHTNDLDFLKIQHQLLKKNCHLPYDFVVGFDKPDESLKALGKEGVFQEFEEYTNQHKIPLIKIPNWVHHQRSKIFNTNNNHKFSYLDPASRCADSVQYMLSVINWQKYKAVLFLDADMFPIGRISDIPVDDQTPFFGVPQTRKKGKSTITYLWNGIFWIDGSAPFPHLINFDLFLDKKLITDVGGQTYKWIELLSFIQKPGQYMEHYSSGSWGLSDAKSAEVIAGIIEWLTQDYRNENPDAFFAELYDKSFLHYRGGGNWQNRDINSELINRENLFQAINKTLD